MARTFSAPHSFGAGEHDAIREICTIGAGHAATALSRLTGACIDMTAPELTICTLAGVPSLFSSLEEPCCGVMLPYGGDLEGRFLLLFPESGVRALERHLLPDPARAGDELRGSALAETATIMAGAFLTVLSRMTGRILIPSPPVMARDMAGAIIDEVLADVGAASDEVIALDFVLRQRSGETIAHALLIPDPTGVGLLLEAAGRLRTLR
jgi:chemotaxis protein CheC